MLRNGLRKGILTLPAVLLIGMLLPDTALARGGYYAGAGFRGYGIGLHRPAYGAVAVGLGVGFGYGYGYYDYPLDDSYDYPSGYGEYAEYGPWAYRGYAGCELMQRRVRTVYGLRWRTVRLCN
jgi:hypothetical protein